MVHKKYIKRDGKTFGPYLYENYREKGVTKTRYLGKAKGKPKKNYNRPLLSVGAILLGVLIFSTLALFFLDNEQFFSEGSEEGLFSYFPINFFKNLFISAPTPLNVFVTIRSNIFPEFFNVPPDFEVCENEALPEYKFYVRDLNGQLDISAVSINPIPPFFIDRRDNASENIVDLTIKSQIFTKEVIEGRRNGTNHWFNFNDVLVGVTDYSASYISTTFNVEVIEVNNPPIFNMSVVTISPNDLVYTVGDDRVFNYDLGAALATRFEETPPSDLIYNLTYVNGSISPFSIDSNGVINIIGNESLIANGTDFTNFHLNLTVEDNGLTGGAIHPNINSCLPNGDYLPLSWSSDFYLTITNRNRVPNITSHYPLELNLSVKGEEGLYFNITARDPDETPLDVYWFVDGVVKDFEKGLEETNVSEFTYAFLCGVSGEHNVTVAVYDGALDNTSNDTITWNITVEEVTCSIPRDPGGGGGSGTSKVYCEEDWACGQWMQCQNLKELVESGWTEEEIRILITERCDLFGWKDDICGFQQRLCEDFNKCNTEFEKSPTIRECHYTLNPTCEDGIKNCHDGNCEILVDCGGSCEACPTCDDGIKNQDEEKIDCGGPKCDECLEIPLVPRIFKLIITYSFVFLLIVILVLVILQITKYAKGSQIFKTSTIKNVLIRGEDKSSEKNKASEIKNSKNKDILTSLFFIGFVFILLFLGNIYISSPTQANTLAANPSDVGFLTSYGMINSLFSNLFGGGLFLISLPAATNVNDRLQIWDDTESYLIIIEERSGANVYFYANFTDNIPGSYAPRDNGECNISLEDWNNPLEVPSIPMNYSGGSQLFEYNQTIDYEGKYLFNVSCFNSPLSLSTLDNYTIANTAPTVNLDEGRTFIDFDGDFKNHDILQCIEDQRCFYDFSANVTDPDINDNLTYSVELTNTTLIYDIFRTDLGLLEIYIQNGIDAGSKIIQLGVIDDDPLALIEWALLDVFIQEVNDAPVFENLENQTAIADDLFSYNISFSDEDGGEPYVLNVSFLSCSAWLFPNCDLFDSSDYIVDRTNMMIRLLFTPTVAQVGDYEINFTLMDYNATLGNSSTSKIVNFTVGNPIWNDTIEFNHFLAEGDSFYLNLSENVSYADGNVNFYNSATFSSFNISSEGIINFTPDDDGVGNWQVEIFAQNSLVSSPKIFNFIISNINDSLNFSLQPVRGEEVQLVGLTHVNVYENANAKIIIVIEDDDLIIDLSQQQAFYREQINLTWNITGPALANLSLLNFAPGIVLFGNESLHIANFIPREGDEGDYNISLYAEDANNHSREWLNFTLTVIDRNYDIPNITYPNISEEFNLKEKIMHNFTFRANHSAQNEELYYQVYLNGSLRDSFYGAGDNTNVTWQFTPTYLDETYGNKTNLTLVVRNADFSQTDLITNKTWNITINHTNAPMKFIREILNNTYPVNWLAKIDLKNYFLDEDVFDPYYNQNASFEIFSNDSSIFISQVSKNWELFVSSETPLIVKLNISAYDLDMNNQSIRLTNNVSNNFQISFEPSEDTAPEIVYVQIPSTGGNTPSSGNARIVSLKIISPAGVSGNIGETLEIPLQLVNAGEATFTGINLNSSALKHGESIGEILTSLDLNYLPTLKPGEEVNFTLTVFLETNRTGKYEILIGAESKSPKYKDWAKIYVDLKAINESQVRELIVFTEEFIASNAPCIEITEVIKEAEVYLQNADYPNAKRKTEEALNFCKEAISQVSIPKVDIKYFKISIYFVSAIILAIILGLVYYAIRRRMLQKIKKPEIQNTESLKN